MAAAPPLMYSENTVKSETFFVTIDLGSQAATKPMTGIFVPENFTEPAQLDVILWLMGHHDNGAYPPTMTIDDYWANYPHFKFRQFVNGGNKNVVLAAPSLGPSSQAGALMNRGGLAWYLDQVLAALPAYSSTFKSTPVLGDLVIACHSGGGHPMRTIATTTQQYTDNIVELWGFDCLYDDVDPTAWTNWAKGNGQKRLIVRYGSGGTDGHSLSLQKMAAKLSNVDVQGSTGTEHNKVPVTYWQRFMRQAIFFADK
ncbi:MAG: hypothetical protein WA324_11510 [Bryobacteraceae bacterium]